MTTFEKDDVLFCFHGYEAFCAHVVRCHSHTPHTLCSPLLLFWILVARFTCNEVWLEVVFFPDITAEMHLARHVSSFHAFVDIHSVHSSELLDSVGF